MLAEPFSTPHWRIWQLERGLSCAAAFPDITKKNFRQGPKNYFALIIQRARMEGFILVDYASRFGEAIPELASWVASGQIAYQEDIQEGFENAPQTFLRLFEGKNIGKQLLKVADPPLPRR
jgi:NADPH-dependent curcumin reductase CurA